MIPVTMIYASAIALLMIYLGARVSILRAKVGISILHGDNMQLAERMRRHGNLVESSVIALVLMGLAESAGMSATWLHVAGGILVLSRLIHPFGIKHDNPAEILRGLGATGTTIATLIPIVFAVRVWTGI